MQYFIPGGWCIALYNFALSKKASNKTLLVASCMTSYILLSIISLVKFRIKLLHNLPESAIVNSALSVILGTFIVCVIIILSQRKWVKKITVKLFHKTLNNNIWRDVFDLEKGSNLKVYLKGKDFYIIGHHKNHEESVEDPWLALSAFAKFNVTTNLPCVNEPSYLDKNDVYIVVRFSDIDHIEVF